MLEMINVKKSFKTDKGTLNVLNGVSFRLEEGKTLGLIGVSGAGKTTIAKILLRLEKEDEGKLLFHGEKADPDDMSMMKRYRKSVQYMSQHPESFLDPNWKLEKSVLEGARFYKTDDNIDERLDELLKEVKLNRSVLERYPHQVSGGEIQRAALCRVLLLDPEVIILDEAVSMLDVSVRAQILNILKDIQKKREISYLMISHDYKALSWFTDDIAELKDGRLII